MTENDRKNILKRTDILTTSVLMIELLLK